MAQPRPEDESSVIRASDISRYVYCNRAWWYDRLGYTSINLAEMQAGARHHKQHGTFVRAMQVLAVIAVLLIIGAVLLAAISFLQMSAAAW